MDENEIWKTVFKSYRIYGDASGCHYRDSGCCTYCYNTYRNEWEKWRMRNLKLRMKGLPTSGPEPVDPETAPTSTKVEPLQFFARQHGVFTTPSSAATFIAENPSLASAAVAKAEGQYYVWSAVGLTEAEIMDSEIEETFRKRLVVDTSACSCNWCRRTTKCASGNGNSQNKNFGR